MTFTKAEIGSEASHSPKEPQAKHFLDNVGIPKFTSTATLYLVILLNHFLPEQKKCYDQYHNCIKLQ